MLNGKGLDGSGYGMIEVLSVLCLEELKATMKNVRRASVPVEIRTEHLTKTRPEGDLYPNPFGNVYGFISTPPIRLHVIVFVSEKEYFYNYCYA
jgi:hypothetical protein